MVAWAPALGRVPVCLMRVGTLSVSQSFGIKAHAAWPVDAIDSEASDGSLPHCPSRNFPAGTGLMEQMNDYILLMHGDAQPATDTARAWDTYLESLQASGRFSGGSAIGSGACYARSGESKQITAHLTGYIRVRAHNLDDARRFLVGNPVFEAGGTVEIRELPRE